MTIMLDSEVKNYKARIYGIIDAIGTLGGTYGIVFWTIMLFYIKATAIKKMNFELMKNSTAML